MAVVSINENDLLHKESFQSKRNGCGKGEIEDFISVWGLSIIFCSLF